jgi:hypothetical protein
LILNDYGIAVNEQFINVFVRYTMKYSFIYLFSYIVFSMQIYCQSVRHDVQDASELMPLSSQVSKGVRSEIVWEDNRINKNMPSGVQIKLFQPKEETLPKVSLVSLLNGIKEMGMFNCELSPVYVKEVNGETVSMYYLTLTRESFASVSLYFNYKSNVGKVKSLRLILIRFLDGVKAQSP